MESSTLVVHWMQKAHEFMLKAYRYTESFPQREIYGLDAQEGRMNLLEKVSRLLNAYAKAILVLL